MALEGVFLPSLLLVDVFPDVLLVTEQFVTIFDEFKLIEEILMLKEKVRYKYCDIIKCAKTSFVFYKFYKKFINLNAIEFLSFPINAIEKQWITYENSKSLPGV